MSWFATNLISVFLLPPLNLLLAALLGLLLARTYPRLGRTLLLSSLALLWLCSAPYFAEGALHLLEGPPKAVNARAQPADAIVVLGGGTYFRAPEYGADTVSAATLVRLRYAAKLQRETGKPILVTGGKPLGNDLSEAQQMKSVLEQEFNVTVRWVEDASDNTLKNARYSHQLLQQAGIKRIYLVSPTPGTYRAPPGHSRPPGSKSCPHPPASPRATAPTCSASCRAPKACATAEFSCRSLSVCCGIG